MLELVEVLVVQPADSLRIVERLRHVHPHGPVVVLEIIGQEPVRHEVEEADFHELPNDRMGRAWTQADLQAVPWTSILSAPSRAPRTCTSPPTARPARRAPCPPGSGLTRAPSTSQRSAGASRRGASAPMAA